MWFGTKDGNYFARMGYNAISEWNEAPRPESGSNSIATIIGGISCGT